MKHIVGRNQAPELFAFGEALHANLRYVLGKRWSEASQRDIFMAVSLAVRGFIIDRMVETEKRYRRIDAKRLYYLSVEYLIGRSLGNNLMNMGLTAPATASLAQLGIDLESLYESELDAGLGNGGLGRLAACFLDSLATLDMPGFGYGINYEHGLFRQSIESGAQRENPDSWRSLGTPWLLERPERTCLVPVYGKIEGRKRRGSQSQGRVWTGRRVIRGVPHDMPIVGYGGKTVNWLRLYSAHSSDEFDIQIFNQGDYLRAFERQLASERISKVLYPPDSSEAGKELRLLQEYFFVACALRDIVEQYLDSHREFDSLPEKVAIQLNDTHPALAIAEFIRLLHDEHGVPFEKAFDLGRRSFAYTNHTLLPEALETWTRPLLSRVVPRHLSIIEEINARFLLQVEKRWPGDMDRMRRMSIIEESHPKHIRMANLAIVGSHAVNGVSELHTKLLQDRLVPDFAEMWPGVFQNKTNGISPRRWLLRANPGLANLISRRIGEDWVYDLERLRELEPFIDDPSFRSEFRDVKRRNKEQLARVVRTTTGVSLDPDSLFDVQIKRIHEYKRQLLVALHAIHRYLDIVEERRIPETPRTILFAGKAAPEYFMAKLIIKLICDVGAVVNRDPRVEGLLRVVFVPDYRVSLAERIIPAADLSEQVSTAGREASGTGNMKLALNGALTIGTLDGANVEIRDSVGRDNIYIFGLRSDEVEHLAASGEYEPREHYEKNESIRRAVDAIEDDRFSPNEPGLFQPIVDNLLHHGDPYFHLADFEAYAAAHERIDHDYPDRDEWARRAALNVARVGAFSSDRTIREYAAEIWNLKAVP